MSMAMQRISSGYFLATGNFNADSRSDGTGHHHRLGG
jgi:hypothetical protein